MASTPGTEIRQVMAPQLPPLKISASNWQRWLSGGISLALLVAIVLRLGQSGFANALGTLPSSPLFWIAFAAYYLALPFSEWLIFRSLWKLPGGAFAALLRKLVSNEVLLGYSGEVYFYAWARRHAKLVAAPFGAVKDVSILSALAGNLMTLAMLAFAWPIVTRINPAFHGRAVVGSTALIIVVSLLAFVFKSRIFSLRKAELGSIFAIHVVRLVATTLLSGLMWHVALPEIPFVWLTLLATLQLLVTRLPFIPNKDMVFASLAIFAVGHDSEVGILIAMIAAAILTTHLIVGGTLITAQLLQERSV